MHSGVLKYLQQNWKYHIISFKGHGNCPIGFFFNCVMGCIYTILHTFNDIQVIIDKVRQMCNYPPNMENVFV